MRDEDNDDDAAATTDEVGTATASGGPEQAPSDAPATFHTPEDAPAPPSMTIPETPPAPEAPGALGTQLPAHAPVDTDPGYNSRGVPTFESVREKIETRYGNSLGATELASETQKHAPSRSSTRPGRRRQPNA